MQNSNLSKSGISRTINALNASSLASLQKVVSIPLSICDIVSESHSNTGKLNEFFFCGQSQTQLIPPNQIQKCWQQKDSTKHRNLPSVVKLCVVRMFHSSIETLGLEIDHCINNLKYFLELLTEDSPTNPFTPKFMEHLKQEQQEFLKLKISPLCLMNR